MTTDEFAKLLDRSEGPTLDFKATGYDLSEDQGRLAFVKDVLCMANTPRETVAHIILGVKKNTDGTFELWGVSDHPDDAILQNQFTHRVEPIPHFTYEAFQYEGKAFGILCIPAKRTGPCAPVKDFGNTLREAQVYFRRGSSNDIARPADLREIMDWFAATSPPSDLQAVDFEPPWDRFLRGVYAFDQSRRYVLVASRFPDGVPTAARALGKAPWTAAVDFDPDSDASGLLKTVRPEVERHRSLYLVVADDDRPALSPERATHWFFARGLAGREGTLQTSGWREWWNRCGRELNTQFERIAQATNPLPVTVVCLWPDPGTAEHLRDKCQDIEQWIRCQDIVKSGLRC